MKKILTSAILAISIFAINANAEEREEYKKANEKIASVLQVMNTVIGQCNII